MKDKTKERKQELLNRTSQIFNISLDECEKLFSKKKSTVTINNNKADEKTKTYIKLNLEKEMLKEISWYKGGYTIETEKGMFTHSKEFENGEIYIQNASSLLPAKILDIQENNTFLDMCAAPGGKTINISSKSNNKEYITVNDENKIRLGKMKKLFEIYNTKVENYFSKPAQYLSKILPKEYFDYILLDAPCSGEGLIDINDNKTLDFWSTKKIKRLSYLQKSIISEAYKLLKPGGYLVYSTCTLAPEENEEVISWILDKHRNMEILDINMELPNNATKGITSWNSKTYKNDCTKCIRIKPNEFMEAFFVCKMQKTL